MLEYVFLNVKSLVKPNSHPPQYLMRESFTISEFGLLFLTLYESQKRIILFSALAESQSLTEISMTEVCTSY